jgi:hypothetical protein
MLSKKAVLCERNIQVVEETLNSRNVTFRCLAGSSRGIRVLFLNELVRLNVGSETIKNGVCAHKLCFGDDSGDEIIYKAFQDNYIYGLSFQLTYHLSAFFGAFVTKCPKKKTRTLALSCLSVAFLPIPMQQLETR